MKKLVTVLIAVFMVFSLVPAAMAAQQVEVKTNSEPVNGGPLACEKSGNITFIFDAVTVIAEATTFFETMTMERFLLKMPVNGANLIL